MSTSLAIDWVREALRMALLLGGPALLAALVVGILVGMLQTATQMHEPVVAQVPKLLAVGLLLLVILPWMISQWVGYASALFHSIPDRI
jgi:flagellar biosynthesis protein FliQ